MTASRKGKLIMTLNKKSVSMTLILSVAMELHRLQEQGESSWRGQRGREQNDTQVQTGGVVIVYLSCEFFLLIV